MAGSIWECGGVAGPGPIKLVSIAAPVTTVSISPLRIIDQRFEKVSYFVFGDFNFRLDSKSVVEVGKHGFLLSLGIEFP